MRATENLFSCGIHGEKKYIFGIICTHRMRDEENQNNKKNSPLSEMCCAR